MTTLETLKAARKLITPESRWLQNEMCQPSSVPPWYEQCGAWCTIGAITAVAKEYDVENHLLALGFSNPNQASTFNDTHTHVPSSRDCLKCRGK